MDIKIFVVTVKRFVCRFPRGRVPMTSRLRGFVDPQILRCKFTVHADLSTLYIFPSTTISVPN